MNRPGLLLVVGLVLAGLSATAPAAERVTLTLRDVSLAEAMAMLAKQQRLNVLLSDGVEGQLSLNLYDVDVEDAVHAIANAAGYAVEYRSGAYFVMQHASVGLYNRGDLTQVQSFNVHYVDTGVLEEMLDPYLSSYGKIKAIPERKLILVSDKPEFLRRIELIVRHADAKPKQVVIEAQILEVTLNEEDSFGINWAKLFDSRNGSGTFGTQGFAGAGTSGSTGFFFDFANPNIDLALAMLEQDGRVRTLSTPKLIALDNQEAEVIIGDRRGYTVTTTINQVTSQSIEFLESGVILRVTPHVDDAGRILMEVHPEVSNGTVDASGVPSQTTTEVTTSLLVPSGETVFIGGLMKHNVAQGYNRVPVLGRIPGIKRLFSSRERTQINTETIVLITPKVVDDPAGEWNAGPRNKVDLHRESLDADAKALHESLQAEDAAPDWLADFQWESNADEGEAVIGDLAVPADVTKAPTPTIAAPATWQTPVPTPMPPPDAYGEPQAALYAQPADGLYTVQVMTMSSRQRLDAYLAELDIEGLPIVPIERQGKVSHALLLGVFESSEQAHRAIRTLPAQLADKTPWVRKLSSLQAAMRRADTLVVASAGG